MRLAKGYIPVWMDSELKDIKKLGRTAFILRLIFRAYRNPHTANCHLNYSQLSRKTGFQSHIIQAACMRLIKNKDIKFVNYGVFWVKKHLKYLVENRPTGRKPTNCIKTDQLVENRPRVVENRPRVVENRPTSRQSIDIDIYKRERSAEKTGAFLSPALKQKIQDRYYGQKLTKALINYDEKIILERLSWGFSEETILLCLEKYKSKDFKLHKILSKERLESIQLDLNRQKQNAETQQQLEIMQENKNNRLSPAQIQKIKQEAGL